MTTYRCVLCGGKLPQGRWITGKDRKITGGIPRYHYPGECKEEEETNLRSEIEKGGMR